MNKLQGKRMQGLALQSALGSAAIHRIGHQRVVQVLHVHTDLVGAPSVQFAMHQAMRRGSA